MNAAGNHPSGAVFGWRAGILHKDNITDLITLVLLTIKTRRMWRAKVKAEHQLS